MCTYYLPSFFSFLLLAQPCMTKAIIVQKALLAAYKVPSRVMPWVSLFAGLDSPLEHGTGTWDWIIRLECGTGIWDWNITRARQQ